MKINHSIALLAIAGTIFIGCSKDDTDSGTAASKTQLLTSHSWRLSASYFNGVELPLDACELDDADSYSTNGIVTRTKGALLCDTTDVTETSTWSFTNNEASIVFAAGTADEFTASILQLDANNLKYRIATTDSIFGNLTIDFNFVKQ
ncbi:MAG: hypothetical protein RL021_461 [Bacteroidota bacterium]|jgi:hypothetical protein